MNKNIFKYDQMKRTEHMAVRESVGWYYFTHQLLELTGPDATAFLDAIYPNDIAALAVGRDRYTTMLDEEGTIIDDVVIMRRAETTYWVSTLYATKTDDWWYYHQGDFDVEWTEITDDWKMYSVQGPRSLEALSGLVRDPTDKLKFFRHAENELGGLPVVINRGGFAGEKLGYEVYCHTEDCDAIEALLKPACEKLGGREVTEFQVFAWTLPTEAGLYYMRDLAHTNPFEVGLEKNINWDKDFVGKEALLKVREAGPLREMLGFELLADDFYVRSAQYGGPGEAVTLNGEEIARVRKLVYSYVKDVNNGYILAKKGVLQPGDHFTIRGYDAVVTARRWIA